MSSLDEAMSIILSGIKKAYNSSVWVISFYRMKINLLPQIKFMRNYVIFFHTSWPGKLVWFPNVKWIGKHELFLGYENWVVVKKSEWFSWHW